MSYETSFETITLLIGVITLIVGVISVVVTNRQTVKSQHLQVILTLSESFKRDWELKWSAILDELGVDHLSPRVEELPESHLNEVRFMLNWVDWLGALKASGTLKELNILTSSIGVPVIRIIHAGHTILKKDCEAYGKSYWNNLFIVASDLKVKSALSLCDE